MFTIHAMPNHTYLLGGLEVDAQRAEELHDVISRAGSSLQGPPTPTPPLAGTLAGPPVCGEQRKMIEQTRSFKF